MITLRLPAEYTEDGEIRVRLPHGIPEGDVEIIVEFPHDVEHLGVVTEPLTGADIVAAGLTGGWADVPIADGQTWVENLRQQHREHRHVITH